MNIRRAVMADAEAIRQIYNIEVTGSTATLDLVPRSPEEQASWMVAHSGVYPVIVADEAGEVVGFACLSPYRPRPGYATAVEDSIYVAAEHRGKGIGRELLNAVVVMARTHGFHSVVARVSATQQASVALHQACGFDFVGVEREIGRKFGRWIDVAILQRLL
ncbi:MAG: N-acetyltransferase family protein [Acidimicrobiales bacterium]|jgi:phosphinothricin acetyltransferase